MRLCQGEEVREVGCITQAEGFVAPHLKKTGGRSAANRIEVDKEYRLTLLYEYIKPEYSLFLKKHFPED